MRLSEDETVFFSRLRAGDTSTVKQALRIEPYLVELQDEQQNTPLHYAVESKSVELVRFLLANNADVNAVDGVGNTPLHWAVESDIMEVIALLLEAGADVNAKNAAGKTSLYEAGRTQVAQLLIDYGADVNIGDASNFTPLHFAAEYAATEMVTFLVTHDAEVNIRDDKGYTPLHLVVCGNIWAHEIQWYLETMEALIQYGADVNALTNDGRTVLTLAIEQNPGRPQLADLLKRYGAR